MVKLWRMPKKTKRDKIIAQYRKKLKLLQSIQSVPQSVPQSIPQQPILSQTPSKSLKITPAIEKNQTKEEDRLISKYFYQDFKKSLIFITVTIALEFSLYFVRMIR